MPMKRSSPGSWASLCRSNGGYTTVYHAYIPHKLSSLYPLAFRQAAPGAGRRCAVPQLEEHVSPQAPGPRLQPSSFRPQASGPSPQPSGPSPQVPALSPQVPALRSQPSALRSQPSGLRPQPSGPRPQPSALKLLPSGPSPQPSGPSPHASGPSPTIESRPLTLIPHSLPLTPLTCAEARGNGRPRRRPTSRTPSSSVVNVTCVYLYTSVISDRHPLHHIIWWKRRMRMWISIDAVFDSNIACTMIKCRSTRHS